ncbi:MAG: LysR family transcriptional regulator [Kofleriaceae bacterium]|nr:LysR family transcriptional regulator [Kofleriaceae bacterium]
MKRIADAARPSLEVRDLELVLALADAKSTVRAASRLHLTQSAVSRGLLNAEDKLGVSLFERTAKGLTPTAAGAELIAGASAVLAQLVELEERARTPDDPVVRVRMVCECYTAYRWLPSALVNLRRGSSRLEVELSVEHTSAPVPALEAGKLDVALLTTSRVRAPMRELPLFADEIVFIVAADHPLARRASITADDLRDYPLISSTATPEPELRWFGAAVFGSRPPTSRLRFPLTEAIVDAARAGMGVAVLSEWIAAPYLDSSLVAKRLRKPLLRPWRIAFRPEAADRARQLAAALGGLAPRIYPQRA